tara:strand:- start:512 stop:1123 length:612 start_codon:yes stop_codon:yes gene_type:complete
VQKINVIIGTNNSHKVVEFSRLLKPAPIFLVTPYDLGLNLEVNETGLSYAENAILKAESFSRVTGLTAIADDSGIEVKALDYRPGIYSARYGGPGLSDSDRTALLLKEMSSVADNQRDCRYVAAIAVCWADGRTETYEEVCNGELSKSPVGQNGFGYDPIFKPEGQDRTMAQLTDIEKDELSHRGKAIRSFLIKNGLVVQKNE